MKFSITLTMLLTLVYSAESYSQSDIYATPGAGPEYAECHGPANGTLLVIGGAASDIF